MLLDSVMDRIKLFILLFNHIITEQTDFFSHFAGQNKRKKSYRIKKMYEHDKL